MDAMYVRHIDSFKDRPSILISMIAVLIGCSVAPVLTLAGIREPLFAGPVAPAEVVMSKDFYTSSLNAFEPVAGIESLSYFPEPKVAPEPKTIEVQMGDQAAFVSELGTENSAESADELTPVLIPAAPAAFTAGLTMLLVVGILSFRKVRFRLFCQ